MLAKFAGRVAMTYVIVFLVYITRIVMGLHHVLVSVCVVFFSSAFALFYDHKLDWIVTVLPVVLGMITKKTKVQQRKTKCIVLH